MDKNNENLDPLDFVASLERRHEAVLQEIDQLADRIETTLLAWKALPSAAIPAAKTSSVDQAAV